MHISIDIDSYVKDDGLVVEVTLETEDNYYPTIRRTYISLDMLAEKLLPYIQKHIESAESVTVNEK